MNPDSDENDIGTGPCKCICGDDLEQKPCNKPEVCKESSSTSSEGHKGSKCYCCMQATDEKEPKDLPLKEYLQDIVSPIVMDGFQAVLQKIPPDPIKFLKDFYKKESDECNMEIPKHM